MSTMDHQAMSDLTEPWAREEYGLDSAETGSFILDYASASDSEADLHVAPTSPNQPTRFVDLCSWGDSLNLHVSDAFPSGMHISDTIIDELALTPPDDPTMMPGSESATESADSTPEASRRGKKRSVGSAATKPNPKQSRTSTEDSTNGDVANEVQWPTLLKLLCDDNYKPGVRPDLIDAPTAKPGMTFKEQPKRRRPHSSPAHRRDKWYNTGGVKSASDRFDPTTNLGMRKRYGKVVREGLPVIRFHEYTLLTRDPVTGEAKEDPKGASLFHLVANTKRLKRSDSRTMKSLRTQMKDIQQMRAKEAALARQLTELRSVIAKQSDMIKEMRRVAHKELDQHDTDPVAAGTP